MPTGVSPRDRAGCDVQCRVGNGRPGRCDVDGGHQETKLILTRRGKKERPQRRRTAETIARTHVAVITAPADQGKSVDLHHEVDLVKASLLYADTVEVLSLGNQMIRELNKFSAGDSNNLFALLLALDDDTLRHMKPDIDLDQFRRLAPLLTMLDSDAIRGLVATDPEMAPLAELADMLDESHDAANSSMAEMRAIVEEMRVGSGVAEIELAMAKRLVRFNDQVFLGGESDDVVGAFVDQLKRYLQDPGKFVLLDATIASLARSMIDEGMIKPPQRAVSNASEVVLGTGFIAHLPAFTSAPMDELMDVRRDLNEPLERYRRKVSQLRSEMQTGPFDEHIRAEVDAIFRTEVNPAIIEIREAMADHKLVKELLRALGGDLSSFVKGSWLPAGIAIFSANAFDLSAAVTAGLTAVSAGGPTVAKGVLARGRGRAEARTHDLYYLYEVDRRLT